jgi:hypothetical protein
MVSLSEPHSFCNDPEANYQQVHLFIFINFSQLQRLEQFHGKIVMLDPDHDHCPFPAPFLIQEMCTRGFHPWLTDRQIPYPSSSTYTFVDNDGDGGVAGFKA